MAKVKFEKKEISNLGKLIDGSVDDLKDHLKGKSLGYLHSLTVLMESTYDQLVNIKNQYIEKANKSSDEEEIKKYDSEIQRVYVELMKIEEKQTFLIAYEKELISSVK